MLAAEWSTSELWLIGVVVLLVLAAGALSLAETALTRMSRSKAQAMVDNGVRGGVKVLDVVEHLERDLNGLFLAGVIVQTSQAALVGIVASDHFGTGGALAAVVIDVCVVFVVAVAGPKTWALQHPERAAAATAGSVRIVGRLLRHLARVLIGATNVILPGKGLKQGPFVTEEELIALAGEAAEAGGIEATERDLIESIIEFGDTIAREIMVPRTDMITFAEDFLIAACVEIAILNGLSRFPVYRENIDDIVGIVYAKDLMRAERDGDERRTVAMLMRAPHFVPETKKVSELLREMQTRKTHIAVVVDEYGGTAGLVTLEDLLEELVGEINDEFDNDELLVETLPNGDVVVGDASINVDDLNSDFDMKLPGGDWDSLGGLVFSALGRVPEVGDVVEVEGYRLVVEEVDGRRVGQVRIITVEPADDSSDDEGDGK